MDKKSDSGRGIFRYSCHCGSTVAATALGCGFRHGKRDVGGVQADRCRAIFSAGR
jgi:hypothetical protein